MKQQIGNLETDYARKKKNHLYIWFYSAIFVTTFLLVFSPFIEKGTSFVWSADGRTQHYPFMVYLARSIRRVLLSWLGGGGKLDIPLYDISLGMGDDIIGLLNVHGYTEPLTLLSALVPTKYSEYSYLFLIIARLYLAGLSFSYLCSVFHKQTTHTLIGSIVYVFSGYAVLCAMRHPYFVTPMYTFPILIIGLEKVLRKERSHLLTVAVFYATLCSYYHLYMMTIMLGVFALVRFFDLYKEDGLNGIFRMAGSAILAYCLGIGLGAVVFFPSVMEFLNANRSGHSVFISFNYSLLFVLNRLAKLVAPSAAMGWGYPVIAAVAVFAIVTLFFNRGRRGLKIIVVVAFLTYMTDIGNFIMNGFQYPSERWTFGLMLIATFVVVEMLPTLLSGKKKSKLICAILTLVIVAAAIFIKEGRTMPYLAEGMVSFALTLAAVMTPSDINQPEQSICRKIPKSVLYSAICLCAVIINVGITSVYWASADKGNYISGFTQFGDEVARLEADTTRAFEPYLSDSREGRVDSTLISRNTAAVWRMPAMVTYTSAVNKNIMELMMKTENAGVTTPVDFMCSDWRTILDTLVSVKYYLDPESKAGYVPYGYKAIAETEDKKVIYENQYALPWGYTYDNAMSYEYLDSLNGVCKEEAMLQAIALDEWQGMSNSEPQLCTNEITYSIDAFTNCTWQDGTFSATKNGAAMTLTFDLPAQTIGYIRFVGLDASGSGRSSIRVWAKDDAISKSTSSIADTHGLYFGMLNHVINLGYSNKARTSLTVTFDTAGKYKLENIELYALPMNSYPEKVEALREEPLENIQWGTNSLTGTIDLSKDKILCISVPYSKGWSATVDGEKAEILRGNYMFMCLQLTAGHHDIELHYCSPGLKAGIAVGMISLGIIIGMHIKNGRKKQQSYRRKSKWG